MLKYMGTDTRSLAQGGKMAEQTYTATPITVGLPSDKTIEHMANRWKVTEQAVAEKLLPKKEYKKWLKQHPKYSE